MVKRMMGDGKDEFFPARKKLSYGLEMFGWPESSIDEFIEGKNEVLKMRAEQSSSIDRAFGDLDFYKRYLIECLRREGCRRLRLEELVKMKEVKYEAFESYLCAMLNAKKSPPSSSKRAASGASKALTFRCDVDETGKFAYMRPYYEDDRTPLQKALGDDKVLQVKFSSEDITVPELFRDIMLKGFDVGLRHFDYFVYKEEKNKPSQKNVKKLKKAEPQRSFFVCTSSNAASDFADPYFSKFTSVESCRTYMMHIHTISNMHLFNKRLQLALSKTRTANINLEEVNFRYIEDIPCRCPDGKFARDINGKEMIHTDGTGFISEDLARKCAVNAGEEYPALLQVRLFYRGMAIKGTLFTLKTLAPGTIEYRGSMLKVKSDQNLQCSPGFNSLEICNTSRKPQPANLSRYVIALLLQGGVPESIFIEAVQEAIAKALSPLQDIYAAYRLCCRSPKGDLPKRMILAGIPLTDHFLSTSLMKMIRKQLKGYAKAKVPLEGSFYLMGTADPTNTLARNQVAILLEHGPLRQHNVLVYKHPGMHPGDVHVFEATWNEKLEHHVGKTKYAIIFPTKGSRSVVHEIANSDLDGDMYWICINEKVSMSFRPQEPWQEKKIKVSATVLTSGNGNPEVIMSRLVALYLKIIFEPNYTIARAATNWLVHMDKYLTSDNAVERAHRMNRLLELVDKYYVALDADKTGDIVTIEEYLCERSEPHFLVEEREQKTLKTTLGQNKSKATYRSTSIFGKIYNLVHETIENDVKEFKGPLTIYPEFMYGDYQRYKSNWKQHFQNYRTEVALAIGSDDNNQADRVIPQYREMLFTGAENLDGAKKTAFQIYEEACAIYSVVHDHVQSCLDNQRKGVAGFTFAWEVAGEPLCNIYCSERNHISVSSDVFDIITGAPGARSSKV